MRLCFYGGCSPVLCGARCRSFCTRRCAHVLGALRVAYYGVLCVSLPIDGPLEEDIKHEREARHPGAPERLREPLSIIRGRARFGDTALLVAPRVISISGPAGNERKITARLGFCKPKCGRFARF